MKQKLIKINENTLKKIVSESTKRILKEFDEKPLHWFDDKEHLYEIQAMIKSDLNPLSWQTKAYSIEEAISKAKKYFVKFSSTGNEKDVDIYYVRHKDFDF